MYFFSELFVKLSGVACTPVLPQSYDSRRKCEILSTEWWQTSLVSSAL